MRDEVGRRSRALVLRVNLASLLAFAVLVPPAMIGIAQRAAEIGRPGSEAAIVALTGTAGSVCGIGGALLLGRLSDARSARVGTRWGTAALGAFVGLSGIVLMTLASAPWMLVAGWSIAEMGCSGALAVLRALLSEALPAQRRRGATAMVILSYLGASVPLLVLLLLPDAIWSTSLVLALCAVALPLAARRSAARAPSGSGHEPQVAAAPQTSAGEREALAAAHEHAAEKNPTRIDRDEASRPPLVRRLPWPVLLAVHFAANLTLSGYLTYHSLEIAEREQGAWGDTTVRLSVLALAAGVLGLLAATGVLLVRPRLLADAHAPLVIAGALLAVTVALRPLVDSAPLLLVLLFCSGSAIGLSSSTLFAAALDSAPKQRIGRRIGVYSAVGPLGQLVSPSLGLAVMSMAAPEHQYRTLFFALSVAPAFWTALVLCSWLRGRRGEASGRGAEP